MSKVKSIFAAVIAALIATVMLCGCRDKSAETGERESFPEPPDSEICPYTGREVIPRPYCYYQLTENEKDIYDKIADAADIYSSETEFSPSEEVSFEELYKIYQLMYLNDYRLFYISNKFEYSLDDSGFVKKMMIKYSPPREYAAQMREKLEKAADDILSRLSGQMSDHEIVKLIHDSVVLRCTYTEDTFQGDNAYGCLVRGEGICQAYARGFAYLCAEAGIMALITEGEAAGEPHMWDMVLIDGEFYHVDPTWDDTDNAKMPVKYDWFILTDEQMKTIRN